jgi:hypothetical protein
MTAVVQLMLCDKSNINNVTYNLVKKTNGYKLAK